jgi:transcriptional regulator with XRE-family HTH domain
MTKQPSQDKKRKSVKKRQPDPMKVAIGKRIREARLRNGLNQPELARQTEVTANAVTQWEGGWTTPSMQNYMNLSKILGTTVEFLRTGVERPGPVEAQDQIEEEILKAARKLSLRRKMKILQAMDQMLEEGEGPGLRPDIDPSIKTMSGR